MPEIVGIRFRRAGRVYYFDPSGLELTVDDWAIVETARGTEAGRVVLGSRQILDSELTEPLKPVLRKAEPRDLQQMAYFKSREAEALAKCEQRVAQHNLPMKLVTAEYNYDGSRITFYFTAEGRVDFRELVRDLASTFRTRIELRQIGVRDEAKMFGGIGGCGRPLCCATFLCEFTPVSIKMAKEQDLPLNPMKISGICGRLLCCLASEHQFYCEAKQRLPRPGEDVNTPVGKGRVVGVNVLKETVTVELESGSTTELENRRVERRSRAPSPPAPEGSSAPPKEEQRPAGDDPEQ